MQRQNEKTYKGSGTEDDPYIVEFKAHDGLNPKDFTPARKWLYTTIISTSVFACTLTSAAYSASAQQIQKEFGISKELFAAGISLYVLGFAVGPALWAPLSEMFGRWILYVISLAGVTTFVAATAGVASGDIVSVLVFRFLSGMFSASPLVNAGATIADMFPISKAGVPLTLFSTAPFLGPLVGPIVGGFTTITIGWRWVQGVCCIFTGVLWIAGTLILKETYGPVILRREAKRLSKTTGQTYVSILDKDGAKSSSQILQQSLIRPWVLLFHEPIVLIASTYLAIIYAISYMLLPAFPIVYEEGRNWNAGIGGLAFLGVIVGTLFGMVYTICDDIYRLQRLPNPSPEDRLPPARVGAIAMPIGLFGFAWTNSPSIHWSASIILSGIFGFGQVPVFVAIINYLVESYTVYAAAVLAAAAIYRSFVGAAFPLFTTQMFHTLDNHWAASIPAFLTLLCLPFPFVMCKYGGKIRSKCKYAHEAAKIGASMQGGSKESDASGSSSDEEKGNDDESS